VAEPEAAQEVARVVYLQSDFAVELLVGGVASELAFASAFHESGELLLVLGHILGIEHPYNGGNDSRHTVSSHNEALDTFDLCILQCVSKAVSFQHSVGLRGSDHLRVDISQHASKATVVVVGASKLAGDPKLVYQFELHLGVVQVVVQLSAEEPERIGRVPGLGHNERVPK